MVIPKTEVVICVGGALQARHEFTPGEYEIGCDPACAIRIEAEHIAGRHARLTVNYSEWFIEDLGSGEATRLNGEAVTEPRRIYSGQRVELGEATVELHRVHGATQPGDSLPPDLAAVRALLPGAAGEGPRYAIAQVVAHGGMGAILAAREGGIEREVAMKIMLQSGSAEHAVRCVQEAKITGQLEHPNIVPVHELSLDEHGQPFYTMKMVHGVTLREVLARLAGERSQESEVRSQGSRSAPSLTPDSCPPTPDFSLPALLTAFQKVCDAVAFAHSRGVIHRDLKPENLMLGEYGEVLVMDWGLAKVLGKEDGGRVENEAAGGAVGGTHAGTILGTPQYMSPEQARGEVGTLDARTDIYALGAILYSILTLRPPVEGTDAREIIEKVAKGAHLGVRWEATAPHRLGSERVRDEGGVAADSWNSPALPPHSKGASSLMAVARKAMAFDRDERYPTVAALQAEITAYQTGFATAAEHASLLKQLALLIQRHRGAFATAAAAWLLITALAVWFVLNLRASERKATRHAEIAAANEQRANTESEARRRALAAAQLALAEAAYREHDGPAMQAALAAVPADLRDDNWRYLLEQADTSLARVRTGSDMIRGVAAHPKKPGVFAVTDSTHRVTLLEARTGVRLLQFDIGLKKDKAGTDYKLAFSPDGERIAVGKGKSTGAGGIAIHSARDGKKLLAWESDAAGKLQFSPDGRRLLEKSDRTLKLWDATNAELLWTFTPDFSGARGHITPDGKHVLVPHAGAFHLITIEDGSDAGSRGALVADIRSFAISPDGRTVLWGDSKGNVRAVDLRDARLLFTSRIQFDPISAVAFTPDGERFVTVAHLPDGRQSIEIWNAKNGTPLSALVGGAGWAKGIAVHPLSGELLIGGQNSRLWEIAATPARWLLSSAASGGVEAFTAAFAGSDDLFFGPANDYPTALLDLRGPSTLWKPASKLGKRIALSSDGRIAALGSFRTGFSHIEVVRHERGKVDSVGAFDVPGFLRTLRLSPTGDRLIVRTHENVKRLAVFDPATGAQQAALDDKSLDVRDVAWIGDGARIVGLATAIKPRGVAKSEERLVVWDAATGQQLRTVAHTMPLDVLAVAPDGRSFAAAGADKLVHVFDAENLAERQSFRAHDGPITALAWHPTRPIVATGSEDLTIKLWNLETGQRLETLRGPAAKPGVLTFSPSGQRLACAAWDRTVRIWEPAALR